MEERIKRQILQAATVLLLLFGALGVYVIYLMSIEAGDLAGHPLNPRKTLVENDVLRGSILDAEGIPLAASPERGAREYLLGEAAAHVIGYYGNKTGSSGIEGYANRALLGVTEEMGRLGPVAQLFSADRGNDVKLTLDADLQQTAWDALAGRRGAVVALDPATGAVLVMASSPSFAPERTEGDWEQLLAREDSPLLNRALSGLYPPGSTIKPMTVDIALAENATDTGEVFQCTGSLDVGGGYAIKESHGEVHGSVTLGEAMRKSCNVTFGTLGMRLGGDSLARGYQRFGFDRPLQGEITETPCHLPDFPALDSGDLAQVGIGQSTLLVTPMHMAMLAAAMAHNGTIMKPYLIDEILSPKGTVLYRAQPEPWMEVTTSDRAKLIDNWMTDVVSTGTGTEASIAGIRVAGKTGTAENPAGEDHAWFIGSADLPGRKVAFAVIVENGGMGGSVAAPIAREIIMRLLQKQEQSKEEDIHGRARTG